VAEIKSKYPDDFAFRRALADQNLPLEKWREDLELTLLQKKVFAAVTAHTPAPSDAELKAAYEANKAQFQKPARVRLRQIVLEKEDDAKRILDGINNGASLEALAKKFSIAPEGSGGGDTGWIEKGTLEVFDQAFKMPVGAKSRILRSPYGWHIFQVLKKEPEGRLSFDAAKAKIRAQLLEANTQKVFAAWLEERVKKSSVQRNDAIIRSIKVTTRES
jgi:peptidyl-prolyl cis-trans isomerase C